MKRTGLMAWIAKESVFPLLLIIAATGSSLSQKMLATQGSDFAARSLSQYVKDIINEKNYSRFGFESLADAQRAKLGKHYEEVLIGLKGIREYIPGATAKELFFDANAIWFPVLVGDSVRTKIEILERGGRLVAGEFGGVRLPRELARVDQKITKALDSMRIQATKRNVLVKVQALQAIFIYIHSAQGEYLVPAMIQPERFSLENGKLYSLADVMSRLKEYVKDIKEDKLM